MMGNKSRMQGKVSLEDSAAIRVYVGIDVCKDWLDVHVHPTGQAFRVPNTREGLKQLKRRLAGLHVGLHVGLIVMEATGKLHREAFRNLHDSGSPSSIRAARASSPRPSASLPRLTRSTRACSP
jgi:transposase